MDFVTAGSSSSILLLDDHRPTPSHRPDGVNLRDFYAYMPTHSYIFAPTREMWPSTSVNARIPPIPILDGDGTSKLKSGEPVMISASTWLDRNQPVEQMTWSPGLPMLIRDRLVADGGWIERMGLTCFNLYKPPTIEPGDPLKANRWINHITRVFGDDAEHIIAWLAHRVQHPDVKPNHALVLGGEQGIGKDTILEPVKHAIGPWNFIEVSPQQMLGRFNGFAKSVVLRISEARDLGDVDRFAFYDHTKVFTAAPPDVLRVDEKNLREHAVFNVCGVIITTNHKTDGIFLPADDRRHFVAWSDRTKNDFPEGYWSGLYGWYEREGNRHVAAYLTNLDLSGFDPKAPPPKTAAFWAIVDANRVSEDAELADLLDAMGNPNATTITRILGYAMGDIAEWLKDRKNRRVIPHRLEKCGYVPVRNDSAESGLWVINGKRQVIYARKDLSERDRHKTASHLAQQ
jgi:uncharacterized protein DUF5906